MTPGRTTHVALSGTGARWNRARAIALGVALATLGTAVFLARQMDARWPTTTEAAGPIFIPRVGLLRPALLGFDDIAADLLWLRTIQYFGGRIEHREKFPQLYQLVDATTSLDPHLLDAYVYGGLYLVIAGQLDQAIAIYEKGISTNPTSWQLPHDLGRLYFLERRDYDKALYWWQIADRIPGRPDYLPRFLIRLQAKMGHRETALELWQQMLESSEDENVRAIARREIDKLHKEMEQRQHAP